MSRILTRLVRADAITLGTGIFLSPGAAAEIESGTRLGSRLLAHELAHVEQYARDGFAPLLYRYALAYALGRKHGLSHDEAYAAIPYEREAVSKEDG